MHRFPNLAVGITLVSLAMAGLGFIQLWYNSANSGGTSSLWLFGSSVLMAALAYRCSEFRVNRLRRRKNYLISVSQSSYRPGGTWDVDGTYSYDNPPATGACRSVKLAKARGYSTDELIELRSI